MKRWAAALAAVLFAVMALSSCGAVRGLLDTERALQRAGFERVDITVDTNGALEVLQVEAAQARSHDNPTDAVAEVVWNEFPFRFDRLHLFVTPEPPRSYTKAELEGLFGPRPRGLDDKSLEDSFRNTGIAVLIVVAVAFLGFLAVVILTIVLVVRSRRKRQAQLPTGSWGPGPPGGWGPPPPGPPPGQWGPPPPPGPPPGQGGPPPTN